MAVIINIKGHDVIVDDADAYHVIGYTWFINPKLNYVGRDVYDPKTQKSKRVYLHRELLGRDPGDGTDVDHANGNRLDNRRCNLRVCSRSQNLTNKGPKSGNASGIRGITWHKASKKWMVSGCKDRKTYYGGLFTDFSEAIKVRNELVKRLHGEFARIV